MKGSRGVGGVEVGKGGSRSEGGGGRRAAKEEAALTRKGSWGFSWVVDLGFPPKAQRAHARALPCSRAALPSPPIPPTSLRRQRHESAPDDGLPRSVQRRQQAECVSSAETDGRREVDAHRTPRAARSLVLRLPPPVAFAQSSPDHRCISSSPASQATLSTPRTGPSTRTAVEARAMPTTTRSSRRRRRPCPPSHALRCGHAERGLIMSTMPPTSCQTQHRYARQVAQAGQGQGPHAGASSLRGQG